jgi:hypothetical protein
VLRLAKYTALILEERFSAADVRSRQLCYFMRQFKSCRTSRCSRPRRARGPAGGSALRARRLAQPVG